MFNQLKRAFSFSSDEGEQQSPARKFSIADSFTETAELLLESANVINMNSSDSHVSATTASASSGASSSHTASPSSQGGSNVIVQQPRSPTLPTNSITAKSNESTPKPIAIARKPKSHDNSSKPPTPKPPQKTTKASEQSTGSEASTSGMTNMEVMFKAFMDKYTSDIARIDAKLVEVDEKIVKKSDDVLLEVSTLKPLVESLKTEVDEMKNDYTARFVDLEARLQAVELKSVASAPVPPPPTDANFPVDATCIVTGVPYEDGEDLEAKCSEFIHSPNGMAVDGVRIVRTCRLKNRSDKSGLVKIQFRSANDKRKVLDNRKNLKDKAAYQRWSIRTSKTHDQRVSEGHTRDILKLFGVEHMYFFTDSGRLRLKKKYDNPDGKKILEKIEAIIKNRTPDPPAAT